MANPHEDNNIIVYTPHKDESIENVASEVVHMVRAMKMDAEIDYGIFVIEVDQTTSEYEIIQTYHEIQNMIRKNPEKFGIQPPKNNNGNKGPRLI